MGRMNVLPFFIMKTTRINYLEAKKISSYAMLGVYETIDHLPPKKTKKTSIPVLIFVDGNWRIGYYCFDNKQWYEKHTMINRNIKYWLPLPEKVEE